ncbi:endomucin isoform X2 [Phacochoerus africanus]|uniref:endomucin isoform X2 n=1 Tax=Phacochoerus africanus TaxID=41426 RepID=UPI001FD8C48D|nr:endomucin isoform X2 [Phacochoerus africanus]
MKLLQGNILFLLLLLGRSSITDQSTSTTASSLSASTKNTTIDVSSSITSATNTPVSTPNPTSLPDAVGKSTTGTFPKGTPVEGTTKTASFTINATVTSISLSDAVLTLQSSPFQITTPLPESSPSETSTLSSISAITTSENILHFQGIENARNASSSTSPSYSSIILPVVIALIVITLSVFVLVGLYRMCWKKDPGTPENGNDQPQSDKESVKLLTVKTISHESGEHSAQGKTKN